MDKTIINYLSGNGYTIPPDETFNHILEWEEWYQGEVKKFHKYANYFAFFEDLLSFLAARCSYRYGDMQLFLLWFSTLEAVEK